MAFMSPEMMEFIRQSQAGMTRGPNGEWEYINPLTGRPTPIPGGNIPVPGQPTPTAPGGGLTQIPTGPTGPPGFMPPQVAMPQLTPNPTPQGLGGMPMIRDRMMGATMAPFAQPNWGIPQVPAQYLTSQQPLPGGSVSNIPVGPGPIQTPPVGMSNPNQQLPAPQSQKVPMVGLGQMGIPRRAKQGSR